MTISFKQMTQYVAIILTSVGVLVSLILGFSAVNANALTVYTLETTPVDDVSIFNYCKAEALNRNPDAVEFALVKKVVSGEIKYECSYKIPRRSGYGELRKRSFMIDVNAFCREVFGLFAINTGNGECRYYSEYSNDTLTVIKSGQFRITKLAIDVATDGALSVNGTLLVPSVRQPFLSRPVNIGSYGKGQQIVLTWDGTYLGNPFSSSSTDFSRTSVSICGMDCWVVGFEGTTNNDKDDLIVRVERI